MSEINIFLEATRQALRFDGESKAGLTTEQLWQLPLTTSRTIQSSLDGIGKGIMRELREQGEESLVTPADNAPKKLLELKLAVVKAIIDTKQAENAAKVAEAAKATERAAIREYLLEKRAEEFKSLSKEALEARLKELGG